MLDKLKKDLIGALKEGDSLKVETIRIILAAIHNEEIAKGKDKELTEKDLVAIVRKEAKKRREAAEIYEGAGRSELAEKENKELEIIGAYLPPEMTDDEIQKLVGEIVTGGETNFGKVMGQVMAKVAGRAEPGRVSEIVKEKLRET